jgi:hypothetical protein
MSSVRWRTHLLAEVHVGDGPRAGVRAGSSAAHGDAKSDKVGPDQRGTPDDWLERKLYSRFPKLGLLLFVVLQLVVFALFERLGATSSAPCRPLARSAAPPPTGLQWQRQARPHRPECIRLVDDEGS